MDSGAIAQADFLLTYRSQSKHPRVAHTAQRETISQTARLTPIAIRIARSARLTTVARRRLRVCRVETRPRSRRLSRRSLWPLLQRSSRAQRFSTRCPRHCHGPRVFSSQSARRLAHSFRPARGPYDDPGAYALASSRSQRMESRTFPQLGGRDRPPYSRFRTPLDRVAKSSRALLSLLPRLALAGQTLQPAAPGSRLPTRPGARDSAARQCSLNP